jgi:LysM repeat protein
LLYAINREATAEQERIETDPTLSETQREIELKRLELEQLKLTAQALGEALLDEPGPAATPPRPEPAKVHRVAAGEGLDRIARIYAVDPAALRAANPGVDFSKLQPGANINVPLRLMYPLPPPN